MDWNWELKTQNPVASGLGGAWGNAPRRQPLEDVVPEPDTVKVFGDVFARYFYHLRQPLDQDQLSLMQDDIFTFLDHTETINPQNWDHQYHNHLWNLHLHYFDYAVWAARAFVDAHDPGPMHHCRSLIEWWIKLTDVGRGDGWHPHPMSLRIVNWVYAYALVAEHYDDQVFLGRWRASIYQQLEYLNRHYRPSGNRLIKKVKALIVGYLFFDKRKLDKTKLDKRGLHIRDELEKSVKVFWEQFEKQVLADGGHYERAPMYHAQVLADLLECYALLREFKRFPPSGDVQRTLLLMAQFLDDLTFPDGNFAQFNDSACTLAADSVAIRQSANDICGYESGGSQVIGRKRGEFPNTGYFAWESDDGQEMIVVDAGPPSAPHVPAHAHCDLLSYQLWFCGRHFITDSGVHGYDGDPYREYCRSTRAHNTVMFDGVEQSLLRGPFGTRLWAKLIRAQSDRNPRHGFFTFAGEYRRYDHMLIHRRHITRRYNDESKVYEWMIEDVAVNGWMDLASSFIHLDPDWSAEALVPTEFNKRQVLCQFGSKRVMIEAFAEERDPDPEEDIEVTILKGERNPVQGWFFPDFGVATESFTIQFDFRVHIGDKFGYRIRAIN